MRIQHHGARVTKDQIVGIQLAGTAQCCLGLVQPIGACEHSARSAAGSRASGASAVAASSASIASGRRPSRSSRTPRAAGSTGFSGSASPRHRARPATPPPSQQHLRRPPGAAHTPMSEATGAAPRQTPIPRAACHRSASARGPRCPRLRPGRALFRSSAAAGRVQLSPSPRMINRPASPSSAASRRGLISSTRP